MFWKLIEDLLLSLHPVNACECAISSSLHESTVNSMTLQMSMWDLPPRSSLETHTFGPVTLFYLCIVTGAHIVYSR